MKKQIATPTAQKFTKYVTLISFLLVLLLPWLKLITISTWINGLFFLASGDFFADMLIKHVNHKTTAVISIIIGYIISGVVAILLYLYIGYVAKPF